MKRHLPGIARLSVFLLFGGGVLTGTAVMSAVTGVDWLAAAAVGIVGLWMAGTGGWWLWVVVCGWVEMVRELRRYEDVGASSVPLSPEERAALQAQLDALEALEQQATAPPWRAYHRHACAELEDDELHGLGLEVEGPPEPWHRGSYAKSADARLIAELRNAAPALFSGMRRLLTALENAEVKNGRLREALQTETSEPCRHCHGSGRVGHFDWIEGRDQWVWEPCPRCSRLRAALAVSGREGEEE